MFLKNTVLPFLWILVKSQFYFDPYYDARTPTESNGRNDLPPCHGWTPLRSSVGTFSLELMLPPAGNAATLNFDGDLIFILFLF